MLPISLQPKILGLSHASERDERAKKKIVALNANTYGFVAINSIWSYCCCCCQKYAKESAGMVLYENFLKQNYSPVVVSLVLDILDIDFAKKKRQKAHLTEFEADEILYNVKYMVEVFDDKRVILRGISLFLRTFTVKLECAETEGSRFYNQDLFKAVMKEVYLDRELTHEETSALGRKLSTRYSLLEEAERNNKGNVDQILVEEIVRAGHIIVLPPDLMRYTTEQAYYFMRYTIELLDQESLWGRLFFQYLSLKYPDVKISNLFKDLDFPSATYPYEKIKEWDDLDYLNLADVLCIEQHVLKLLLNSPKTTNSSGIATPAHAIDIISPTTPTENDVKSAERKVQLPGSPSET